MKNGKGKRYCEGSAHHDRFGCAPCTRKGKLIKRKGKLYCWQHDPVRIARLEKERNARWAKESKDDDRRWRQEAALERKKNADHAICEKARAADLDPHEVLRAAIEAKQSEDDGTSGLDMF